MEGIIPPCFELTNINVRPPHFVSMHVSWDSFCVKTPNQASIMSEFLKPRLIPEESVMSSEYSSGESGGQCDGRFCIIKLWKTLKQEVIVFP